MITSMTGFGTADGVLGSARLTVEIRAVNHRFFNPTIKLPASLQRWETDVRESLRKRFARGHITLAAWIERPETEEALKIDEARVTAYVAQLRDLSNRLGLAGEVDLATVMRLPEVFSNRRDDDPDIDPAQLFAIVDEAAAALASMREVEGDRIAVYLAERLAVVSEALARIEKRAPERLVEQRVRMQNSIAELLNGLTIDPQRVAQEVAILADRIDVAEEMSRFRGHIEAFHTALDAPRSEAVGKRLGFLLQEMLREANTTGSKSNDSQMLADVVIIKEELERLREQVENVE